MIIIFGIIAVVVVAWYAWRYRDVRNCRWRAERSGDKGSLRKYRCIACGAEAFTATKGPPRDCRKDLSPPSL
ncbi:hypothetical protein ABMC89_14595 [Sulfitobacter sp. HNIBRBA3233]|uniref:hypothetical protein n=1 Tax=Sulfitobacter marinivivus TaxID=3158558 RepID=UPI0032E05168